MMKAFIGSKIVRAKPMGENDYLKRIKNNKDVPDTHGNAGYLVQYPDGYLSWSPKDVFEEAYRAVSGGEKLIIQRDEG